jgi:hypothetical protein
MKSLKVVAAAASLTLMASGVAHAQAPSVAHRSLNIDLSQSGCVDNAVDVMTDNKFSPVRTGLETYVVGSYGENKAVIVCQASKGLVTFIASGPDFSVATCIVKGLLANFKEKDDTPPPVEFAPEYAPEPKGCPFS